MNLLDLLALADEGYGDGAVAAYYDPETGEEVNDPWHGGDTLALFVYRELKDTFDPEADEWDQLREAIRTMEMAKRDLDHVIDALVDYRHQQKT